MRVPYRWIAIVVVAVTACAGGARAAQSAASSLPLVVLLDSAYPARVYDEATIARGRTNADVLSDLLSDLPIRRHAEAISPDWRRDEAINALRPALIVVHYSGFNLADATGPRQRLKLLIAHFATTDVKFLVYSRAKEAELRANLDALLADVYKKTPALEGRVRAFGLLDHGPPQWIGTASAVEFKRIVKALLGLA